MQPQISNLFKSNDRASPHAAPAALWHLLPPALDAGAALVGSEMARYAKKEGSMLGWKGISFAL